MTAIQIRLFGVLQQWMGRSVLSLEVMLPLTSQALKKQLVKTFSDAGLNEEKLTIVHHCVLADDHHIFSAEEEIGSADGLAILPPFSGG